MSRFIFMLTRDDVTVPDALSVCDTLWDLPVDAIGFKDVGLPIRDLRAIVDLIHEQDREAVLEVVSETREEELRSVTAGLELEVDLLLGGVNASAALKIIGDAGDRAPRYCPFPGRIVGHPSSLRGTVESVTASARELAAMDGVWGLDLLGYRFDGAADELIRSVVSSVRKPVILAGSVDSADRVRRAVRARVWGFTVGTAAFERRFAPGAPLADQLRTILKTAHQAAEHVA